VGARYARCVWTAKLATSTVTGSSRYRPQASDQHRKIRSRNGNRAAAGFQMSWNVSAASDMPMIGIAAAIVSGRPASAAASRHGHARADRAAGRGGGDGGSRRAPSTAGVGRCGAPVASAIADLLESVRA